MFSMGYLNDFNDSHSQAAIIIQSIWRGYRTRKKLSGVRVVYTTVFNELNDSDDALTLEWTHNMLCAPLVRSRKDVLPQKITHEASVELDTADRDVSRAVQDTAVDDDQSTEATAKALGSPHNETKSGDQTPRSLLDGSSLDIGDLESLPSTNDEQSNVTVSGADTVVFNTCHGTDLVDSLHNNEEQSDSLHKKGDHDDDQAAREEQVDSSSTIDQRVDNSFTTEQQVDSLRDQQVDSVHGTDSEAEVKNSDRLEDVGKDNDEPQPDLDSQRTQLYMELLWTQQAISSRKQYLKMMSSNVS